MKKSKFPEEQIASALRQSKSQPFTPRPTLALTSRCRKAATAMAIVATRSLAPGSKWLHVRIRRLAVRQS